MRSDAPGPGAAVDAAQHSPLLVYVTIFVLVVSGLAQAIPKVQQILGPLGKFIGGRSAEAKRAAIASDAEADRLRDEKLQELLQWKDAREKEDEAREQRDREHYAWDLRAFGLLMQTGVALKSAGIVVPGLEEIEPPPPLY